MYRAGEYVECIWVYYLCEKKKKRLSGWKSVFSIYEFASSAYCFSDVVKVPR